MVIKHPVLIILLAIILCVSGFILDANIDSEPDVLKYLSDDLQSVQDLNMVMELTGGRTPASILVEADNVADPKVMEWMLKVEDRIKTNEPERVGKVQSFVDMVIQATGGTVPDTASTEQILSSYPRPFTMNLINDNHTAANLSLTLPAFSADELKDLRKRLVGYISDAPAGVTASVTGSTIVQDKMGSGLTSDRIKMTLLGIGLVLAGLLVLFRFRVKRAIAAALPTVFIIGWAAIIVYLIGIEYTPAGATRAALAMGIGVMFTVLLMNRYYEERNNGQAPAEAITSAMVRVGRPIIACGLTVIGGFAALLMATSFPFIQNFGIITLVTIFFGLVSTLVVLPPLLIRVDAWEERIAQHKARRRSS
jgi:hydrophobe/amphiphile efflux-3 (HAE3) family protein